MILTNITDFSNELLSWDNDTTTSYLLMQYAPKSERYIQIHAGHRYILSYCKQLSTKVVVHYRPLSIYPFDINQALIDIVDFNLGEDISFIDQVDYKTKTNSTGFFSDFESKWSAILEQAQILFQTTESKFIQTLGYFGMVGAYSFLQTYGQILEPVYNHLEIITPWACKDVLINQLRGNVFGSGTNKRWFYVPTFYDDEGIIPSRNTNSATIVASKVIHYLKDNLSAMTNFSQLTNYLNDNWLAGTVGDIIIEGKYYIINPFKLEPITDLSNKDYIFLVLTDKFDNLSGYDWIGLGNRCYNNITKEFIEV